MRAKNYWLCTVRPEGRPHCIPSWGSWIDGKLYFGGGEDTRHSRNLLTNPNIVVHLEDGTDSTMVEGTAEKATNIAPEIVTSIEEDYLAKYGMRERPNYVFTPKVAFAWYGGLNTATRFLFDENV